MKRKSYSTDLTDEQWQRLECLLPKAKNGRTGAPRKYPLREVLNALFYQVRTGCAWRLLPHDFPPYTLVWYYFRRWRDDGTLQRLHDALYEQVRHQEGREAAPSAGAMDSQAVRTTEKGGLEATSEAKPCADASGTS